MATSMQQQHFWRHGHSYAKSIELSVPTIVSGVDAQQKMKILLFQDFRD